jgi:hypothetical protein
MNVKKLLTFVKENVNEISENVGCIRIEEIKIDALGDVSGTGIYLDDEGDEMESGLSFRWSYDVNDDFVGEDGDESIEIMVNGKEISYVGYNI